MQSIFAEYLSIQANISFLPQPFRFSDIIAGGNWGVIGRVRLVDGDISEPSDTTEHLIERVKAGDARAFERLISEHYRFIYKTAFRWLGHKSDAEDVTQSVCMRLANAIGHFDGRSKFTSWLYSVTLNAVRDLQRNHKRQGRHVDAVAAVACEEIAPDQENQLRVNDIWRIVRQLPEKQRDAVMLVFGEQLSQAEAAVIMGCKEVTVSWHIHNARKSLKDLL
ncbi:MAG: RNA polymerase sigma factor [Candidatus Devosia phytovorans]|uniref:RNA polymerase sigma factor n=1 Tax=Candidatus Devosia phytovorans TaxID=3121372 RepID=A0AAJ5VRH0_9HYPH|nr:RNA polymerase sigma factor [Devosia sp.]WEK03431.1 MAG: RNA polymerase sigma factor [Devosia sp.]